MVWDFGTKPAAPSALDPNAPDPRYGGNVQNQVENPAWLAWNEQQNRYKSDIRKMQGVPGYENHIAYTQQLLEQGWANEPPRYTQTALGQDVQNVRDQGAQAVTNLATARDNQLQTGQDAYDSGRQAAAAASTQAGAAQGRTGPTLDVGASARRAEGRGQRGYRLPGAAGGAACRRRLGRARREHCGPAGSRRRGSGDP
jgi:hypothetical protein